MSHYEQLSSTTQPFEIPVHRGEAENHYESVTSVTALAHTVREAPHTSAPNVPPLPQGGHLHTYSTLFTDSKPAEVLGALTRFFAGEGIDYVQDGEYTIRCYPCFGRTQVPIEICSFSNVPSERSKGAFALEFRNQSLDSVNFFNIFRTAKDVLITESLVQETESRNQGNQDGPLGEDDFLPALNFAAFDMSLLDDDEIGNDATGDSEDLTASFEMLVNITNQEDSSTKTEAVRGIVDVMGKNAESVSVAITTGAFDVLTMCMCEAAEHLSDSVLELDAASPLRDMCHNAISGIANACEVSDEARMATIRSGALHALLLFVSSLADPYEVHCRELVRESLRAYIHTVRTIDQSVMTQLLEKPLIEQRSCGSCIADMISSLENHLSSDCRNDRFLKERVETIKRQLVNQ